MKNIIFFENPFFEMKDVQKLKEEESLFKPIHINFPVISSIFFKKKGPENKIIIYDEDSIGNINIEISNDNVDVDKEYDIKNDTLERTEDIIIEIHNNDSPKFIIKKDYYNVIKKKGRKRKSSLFTRSIHTKYSRDNILRKIKGKFMHRLLKYINRIILQKYKAKINILLPLEGEISQNNTNDYNRVLLNLKLKDIFMNFKISRKFKSHEDSYNNKVIQIIYEKNILELISILECTFLEAFKAFTGISNNQTHKLNEMDKLSTVIEEIKNKENNEDYLNKFQKVAINFENIYFGKKVVNF
jgi:hypothetical protein